MSGSLLMMQEPASTFLLPPSLPPSPLLQVNIPPLFQHVIQETEGIGSAREEVVVFLV